MKEFQKQQLEAQQFVFGLHPKTLLPIDVAAPIAGKTTKTFSSDVTRRPECLPRLTRRGRRVFVSVGDLLDFISSPQQKKGGAA